MRGHSYNTARALRAQALAEHVPSGLLRATAWHSKRRVPAGAQGIVLIVSITSSSVAPRSCSRSLTWREKRIGFINRHPHRSVASPDKGFRFNAGFAHVLMTRFAGQPCSISHPIPGVKDSPPPPFSPGIACPGAARLPLTFDFSSFLAPGRGMCVTIREYVLSETIEER